MKLCTVEGCERHVRAKGFCGLHYQRHRNGVPLDAPMSHNGMQVDAECAMEGCNHPVLARSLCRLHYNRLRRWGHLDEEQRSKEMFEHAKLDAVRAFWQSVDKRGDCWVWLGSVHRGYGRISWLGQSRYVHRISFELAYGHIPEGMQIDHRCHTRRCVNPEHLRLVTPKQNCEHLTGANANNKSSGLRGVTRNHNKWKAEVRHNRKHYYLGTFETVEEANSAAVAARKQLFTHDDYDEWVVMQHGENNAGT